MMLFPRESECREVKDLSGIWSFKVDKESEGRSQKWYHGPLSHAIMMPVPSSYNDITQDASIRDHIGDVWYETNFFVPASWKGKRVILRVGSASHTAEMWVNGTRAAWHKGGYLPFEADVSDMVGYGEQNRVTIAVNNILDWTILPPGEIQEFNDPQHPAGFRHQEYFCDFYNFSGIHRPVKLYSTPKTYIADITVTTDIEGTDGIVRYSVKVEGGNADVQVILADADGHAAAEAVGQSGELRVPKAHLWEPGKGYLYTLVVKTVCDDIREGDCYRLPVGIRTVNVEGKEFLINGKPFYFKGFGRHEDSDIRGRGLDNVINIKDFNLMKWIGANSFRTSHYPYSDEIMELADREGMIVIDEAPAVGFNFWDRNKLVFIEERAGSKMLEHHLQMMKELIERDKNHPCVVMWSVANEANTYEEGAVPYFKTVADETRRLDPSRPITIVQSTQPQECRVAQFFDVVCVNRYYSWYVDPGRLETIKPALEHELKIWYEKFQQPVIVSEFGADTIAGFHQDPPVMFTEEYQCELIKEFQKVFDSLDFVIGEHVWNFADFATKQGVTRIVGNKKGVFTRQRQPKAAAHMLKQRWTREDGGKSME